MTVLPGEVHGLLGENGSGKSTLIKILAGFHDPDAGELEVDGEPVKLPLRPGRFRDLGLAFVHQDLGLVNSLSVVENLRVAELVAPRHRWRISWAGERRRARQLFALYGLAIDPRKKVGDLRPVERALLAIVRAVEEMRRLRAGGGGLLVLDEPTVFLPREGIDRLFSLVRGIAASGASVLFISHDLDEVREITDRVTVIRDGKVVDTVVTADADEQTLVRMIIGRHLGALGVERRRPADSSVGLTVRDLSGGSVRHLSLDLRAGEVVGLTGLLGSGFEDVPYLLCGALRARSGILTIDGHPIELPRLRPPAALEGGIALLPGDRQTDGSVGSLSVADNVSLPVVDRYFRIALRRRRMVRDVRERLVEFDVRPNRPRMRYGALSGGNQQKALLAKWLQLEPRLLLLHEPTQGVDVGAREQIFALTRRAAERGAFLLCASSDYEQLAGICDRVVVFGRGRTWRELAGSDVTKERIVEQCFAAAATEAAVLTT